eukprot:10956329-Lingulodinium_polyedra.AAC.1
MHPDHRVATLEMETRKIHAPGHEPCRLRRGCTETAPVKIHALDPRKTSQRRHVREEEKRRLPWARRW